MNKWVRTPNLSAEEVEELKNQWFTLDEAIEELAINGEKLTEASFRKGEKQLNFNKEIPPIGKPEVKDKKTSSKGRPPKLYNRAFVEALRTFAYSDTYKRFEEAPIDYFQSSHWKEELEEDFKEILKDYISDPKDIYGLVKELSGIVSDNIMVKSHALIGQNKLLIHQNKKLEDTKEYYIAMYRGVEENANLLNDLTNFIKNDIANSSAMLSRKEANHFKQTLNTDKKLNEIMEFLKNFKDN